MTQTHSVDYSGIGASKLFRDYLEKDDTIMPFFRSAHFSDLSSWKQKIRNRSNSINRNDLVDALLAFHEPFHPSEKTIEQIKRLGDDSTFTIVTGQQLTLFGGPLYTLLKTITAIKTAKTLSSRFNVHIVPVFWLADEDHDFQEISEIYVPDKDEPLSIKLESHPLSGSAAGFLDVTAPIPELLAHFISHLPDTEFKPEMVSMLKDNWTPGKSWKTAFGKMMLHFFGEEGLILAGSNHPQIKKYCRSLFSKAISENEKLLHTLQKTSAELEQNWFTQAQTGDSTLFYHDSEKGRTKLIPDGSVWKAGEKEWTVAELLNYIDQQPERFSPNVFLRPLVQEFLLPNLAYVGGPAEIAYHAQMGHQFEQFRLEMPILVPRLSVTLSEPGIDRFYEGLPFTFEEYMKRVEDLQQEFIKKYTDSDFTGEIERWKQEIERVILSRESFLDSHDATLTNSLKGASARTLNEIDKIHQKLNRSLKQQESVQLNRILRVKQAYFPINTPQERIISWVWYLTKYGNQLISFLSDIISDDFESLKKHHLVSLNKMNL